jgi:hypothetical protein
VCIMVNSYRVFNFEIVYFLLYILSSWYVFFECFFKLLFVFRLFLACFTIFVLVFLAFFFQCAFVLLVNCSIVFVSFL